MYKHVTLIKLTDMQVCLLGHHSSTESDLSPSTF